MKTIARAHLTATAAALALTASIPALAQPRFVYESRVELNVAADFDGDSHDDIALVDRASGHFRIGYQLAPGSFTWAEARASGLSAISGLGAGRLLNAARDAFIFTAPEGNRLALLEAPTPTSPAVPVGGFSAGIGPQFAVAIDIGGFGNTPLDDVYVTTSLNFPIPLRAHTVRNLGAGAFSTLLNQNLTTPWTRLNAVRLQPGIFDFVVKRAPTEFAASRLTAGAPQELFSRSDFPANFDYVVGSVTTPDFVHVLAWTPGTPNLSDFSIKVATIGVGGTLLLEKVVITSERIDWVRLLPSLPRDLLLVAHDDGMRAAIYEINATQTPTLRQSFLAPNGSPFTGAGAFGGGSFVMFNGRNGVSRMFQQFDFNGATWALGAAGELPAVKAASLHANVIEFDEEPFVHPAPQLLRALNAGEWTAGFAFGVGPSVQVSAETFLGSQQGLDNPTSVNFGPPHSQTQFGLVNQLHESFCLFSFSPPVGEQPLHVTISPDPGKYRTSVALAFTPNVALANVHFRLNGGAWITYNSAAPQRLLAKTTVQYFAQLPASQVKSPIYTAEYDFELPPGALDSDRDGVPDFVEVGKGLDPELGSDGDADGFSDFEELLGNTEADDPTSMPGQHLKQPSAGVRLAVRPLSWDPVSDQEVVSPFGVPVRVHDLTGKLLGSSLITNPPVVPSDHAALFADLPPNPLGGLYVLATDPHFPIETGAADKNLGRELLGAIAAPPAAPFSIAYEFGSSGGNLAAEANAWIAAAAAAQEKTDVPLATLQFAGTRLAAIFERQVVEMLRLRNVAEWTNLTLFPFRLIDAARYAPLAELLASLETAAVGAPSWRLRDVLAQTETLMANGPSTVAAFNTLATQIYRLNIESNNATPGRYAPAFETLRQFVNTGTLPESYATDLAPNPQLLADAAQGVAYLVASIMPRPVTNIVLRVPMSPNLGLCTTLETDTFIPSMVHLFGQDGSAFDFPDPFLLLPGTIVVVTGFTDVSSEACPGAAIEVINALVLSFPPPDLSDANGNLLTDMWEKLFPGLGPFGDTDNDGYSDLQEMFEGTDPNNPGAIPLVPAADLTPPQILITSELGGTQLKLTFAWPEPYA
ncbi:MAG TPA: thrombospondin type 3 repeat-containing protein, partial [Verrucomicrobiae bacterium]|nr:thrombospondin type 3 repeat-containing protein [Verrucomicrobiae bacterium]